ncbi:MAG: PepSY domain-containing protein [Pseudomonadota bacterium]|nr:PepSY domain-containing protein [Pseudomonadota bacterium]
MWTAPHGKRLVYLVHRWTGVGGCILMLLWVLSGGVMLFVGYPKLLPEERLQKLPPLDQPGCCVPVEVAVARSRAPSEVQQIKLTSVADQPRYLVNQANGDYRAVDAVTGRLVPPVDGEAALTSARAFLRGVHAEGEGPIDDDRWTHSGALDAHRPLFKVQMHDAEATLLYVSSTTGEVVMDAPLAQRNWNYAGAWLHWLYMFRDGSRDPVWSWLVIVLSTVCTVSALTGALAGLWRWRFSGHYKSGSKTPYRAFQMHWHHITGLLFGVVLVAWIFSGLMSMNPLGIFDPKDERPNQAAYRQGSPGTVRPTIDTSGALTLLHKAKFAASEIEWRVMGGVPYLLARNSAGTTRLVVADATGFKVIERWADDQLAAAGTRLMKSSLLSAQAVGEYDAYYYQRQATSMYGAAERHLPVLRLDFADSGRTLVYLDPYTGDVALSVDRSQRIERWLFNLLHSWDLPSFLRFAAAREAILIVLSLGSLAIAVTGTVIGYRRLKIFWLQSLRKATARAT